MKRVRLDVCKRSKSSSIDCLHTNYVETGEVTETLRPDTSSPTPLTCLALGPRTTISDDGATQARSLYAGCWDKNVYSWELLLDGRDGIRRTRKSTTFRGHTDFVKAVVARQSDLVEILMSASADGSIIVWESKTGAKLHVLKGHARGVQALAIDPSASPSVPSGSYVLFSGDSKNEIRSWKIEVTAAKEIAIPQSGETSEDQTSASSDALIQPLVRHETSIYALAFESDPDSSYDLWTASADKTAKCLSRLNHWAADTELQHPDFVKDIAIDERTGRVITACRDEEVRLWDKSSGKLIHTFSGHFEEVTGLACVWTETHYGVASVSIDGTVRFWSLKAGELRKAIEDVGKPQEEEMDEEKPKESLLTEEEEAELAELMEDD